MPIYNKEWSNYVNNYKTLLNYGVYNGLIRPFNKEIFEKLRHFYQDNIPAVLLLLDNNLTQKHCYERAKLISLAFDDEFEIITAHIDALRYNPIYVEKHLTGKLGDNYSEHCYVRRHFDGRYWIYDTSLGFMMEEHLYNDLEHPEITSKRTRKVPFEEINIKKYNKEELKENSDSIKMNIDTFKDNLFPTNEYNKDLIEAELKKINEELENLEDKQIKVEK